MINKTIIYNGNEYIKGKTIQGKSKEYIEYRNEELHKMKFFEIYGENIQPISDLEDLRQAIDENYVIGNKDDII